MIGLTVYGKANCEDGMGFCVCDSNFWEVGPK